MKKTILVIGVAVIVVGLLIAAWIYVMFFGTPRELPDLSNPFGFGGSEQGQPLPQEPVVATTSTANPVVNVTGKPLRQLTTRPVIGYRELAQTGTSSILLYAEAGTGHVYSIDLTTGAESRRSGTTIIEAAEAVFSVDGAFVVYRSGYNRVAKTVIGTMSSTTDSLTTNELGELAENMHIEGNEVLFYSVRGNSAIGKSRNLRSGASKTLFTLPMSDPVVLWGRGETADHFIYPKPSYLLPGYVYRVGSGGSLTRLPVSGFGLSAFRSGPFVGISTVDPGEERYETTIIDTFDNTTIDGLGAFIPEKCASSLEILGRIWCVQGNSSAAFGYPDTWHRGQVVNNDVVVELFFTATGTTITTLVDTLTDSGRTIDGFNYSSGPDGTNLYFINRLDNTLWLYDLDN
jgi:hypothetical protein